MKFTNLINKSIVTIKFPPMGIFTIEVGHLPKNSKESKEVKCQLPGIKGLVWHAKLSKSPKYYCGVSSVTGISKKTVTTTLIEDIKKGFIFKPKQ